MTKSRIARRIYKETPKETNNMVRLYGNYVVERENKKTEQSKSVFTEAMFECSSGTLQFNKDGSIELIFQSSINPKK